MTHHDPEKKDKRDRFSFNLKSDLSELDDLHSLVDQFGHVHGLSTKVIFEANLALEEIFTNIVSYGHVGEDVHVIRFSMERRNNCLIMQVEDDGVPFNLLEAPDADLRTDLEERSVGGLGIHLVRTLMDQVTYQRLEEKNVVTLQKDLKMNEG